MLRFHVFADALAAVYAGETDVDVSGVQLSGQDLAALAAALQSGHTLSAFEADNCFIGQPCCAYVRWVADVLVAHAGMRSISCTRVDPAKVCVQCMTTMEFALHCKATTLDTLDVTGHVFPHVQKMRAATDTLMKDRMRRVTGLVAV